jgi:hypothetical protein
LLDHRGRCVDVEWLVAMSPVPEQQGGGADVVRMAMGEKQGADTAQVDTVSTGGCGDLGAAVDEQLIVDQCSGLTADGSFAARYLAGRARAEGVRPSVGRTGAE